MSIAVHDVCKRFGAFVALDHVSLEVVPGELVALLGPSGSGKTTLLRVIAGLERPDSGTILFDGEDAASRAVGERQVGFVFQHYALFRHMTVFENVAFGLRVKKRRERPSEADIRRRVRELLELVQLDWLGERYPNQLSGGQRQRIALARALAIEPKVLLLDEPFGALDAKVRKDLRRWLRRLHDDIHLTSVFVTHDQEEALEVADRIVVFNHGRIEQVGEPHEVYDHPVSPFVYEFLGHANRFEGQLAGGAAQIGANRIPAPDLGRESGAGIAFARSHDLMVVPHPSGAAASARLEHIVRVGSRVRLECVRLDDGALLEVELTADEWAELGLKRGQTVHLAVRRARVFAPAAVAAPDEGIEYTI